MNTPDKCPFCGCDQVLAGKVIGREGYGFKPDDTITGFVFTLRDPFAFAFGPAAHYCAACGMIWSKANAKDAAKFLKKFVTGNLQARLATLEAQGSKKTATPRPSRPPVA